jgi:hypothetical protein
MRCERQQGRGVTLDRELPAPDASVCLMELTGCLQLREEEEPSGCLCEAGALVLQAF